MIQIFIKRKCKLYGVANLAIINFDIDLRFSSY